MLAGCPQLLAVPSGDQCANVSGGTLIARRVGSGEGLVSLPKSPFTRLSSALREIMKTSFTFAFSSYRFATQNELVPLRNYATRGKRIIRAWFLH